MTTTAVTDRIEKSIFLRAPRTRVWRALTNVDEFAQWFGTRFTAPFAPGAQLRGKIVGTKVDPEIAKSQLQYADVPFEITVDRMEPERLFSFRWHPYAVDKATDYSSEPTTLITFTLDEVPEGTRLTVTESGFDRIPMARRAEAFTANEQGWTIMVTMIEKYLAHGA
jgi:uncharacterized protein YndB with AHSA1/START domain